MPTHEYFASDTTSASPTRVWQVWSDVTSWPTWTTSVSSIEPLEDALPLRVGSRFRVRQPRLAPATWTVTELDEGRSFTWTSSAAGVSSVGTHVVEPDGSGARFTSGIEQHGPLAGVVKLLLGGLVRRYLGLEADGLRHRAEELPPA